MRAFIHAVDQNGKDILGTGFPRGGCVTNEYLNIDNLIRCSLRGLQGTFHIEAFYSWGNRYGKADIDIIVNQ